MNREHGKSVSDICENDFVTKGTFGKRTTDSHTTRIQSSELTGSDDVMIRYSRAAAVVFVLLCVLLLTARIILCATFTQERQQLLTKITNLTEERDHLQTNNMNLTEERDQLLTNNIKLTKERDQLLTNNMNLKEERDQLKSERNELQKHVADGWKYYQSSLYFISSEKKSWTESRRYCRERAADLIIINNTEEQDFLKNISCGSEVWIGLTDIEVEGRWKWVDGSYMTLPGFWVSGEPNSNQGKEEDCAITRSSGWVDISCDSTSKWICEKNIFK